MAMSPEKCHEGIYWEIEIFISKHVLDDSESFPIQRKFDQKFLFTHRFSSVVKLVTGSEIKEITKSK